MKKVCIVLRNNKNSMATPSYIPIADALLSGGYFLDETSLIPYENVSGLHAKIRENLGVGGVIAVVADSVLIEGVTRNLSQTFSFDFQDGISVTDSNLIAVIPADEKGETWVKGTLVPAINKWSNTYFDRMVVRMVGAPKERVDNALNQAYEISGDTLAYNYVDDCADGRLEIIYDANTPKMIADKVLRVVLQELNDYVYALDDTPLERRVYECLAIRKRKLSVAESFTGGRVCAKIVSVSGASSVFYEGLNTYANEAKMMRLGVKEETLRAYGAVSAQTAHEMAQGLFVGGQCDVCVATTGIAGPQSDNTKKPVGLAYIAAGIDGRIFVNEYHFTGDRERITNTAVNFALFSLVQLLKD